MTVYQFVARVQSPIDTFDKTVVAGNSAGQDFIYIAMNSIHIATTSFASQNFGARQYHRIWHLFYVAEMHSLVTDAAPGSSILFFVTALLKLYISNTAVVSYALVRIRVLCSTCFPYGTAKDAEPDNQRILVIRLCVFCCKQQLYVNPRIFTPLCGAQIFIYIQNNICSTLMAHRLFHCLQRRKIRLKHSSNFVFAPVSFGNSRRHRSSMF